MVVVHRRYDLGFVDGAFCDVLETEVDDEMTTVPTCPEHWLLAGADVDAEYLDPHRNQISGSDDINDMIRRFWLRGNDYRKVGQSADTSHEPVVRNRKHIT
jgi:hypothetical protein